MTMHRGESASPLQPASGQPGQFSAQRSLRVYSHKVNIAGIFRQFDCEAVEHEHPEAQLSMLFRGNADNVLHDVMVFFEANVLDGRPRAILNFRDDLDALEIGRVDGRDSIDYEFRRANSHEEFMDSV